MSESTDDELRMHALQVARQRARKRRDGLTARVDVLDELYADHDLSLPAHPTIVDVAAYFGIDRGPLTTLVRHFGDELRHDGWQPHHPRRPGLDRWTDEAIVRAALLLDEVGCNSEVAAQIRYHLGQGELPLMFSATDARLKQCAALYERANAMVGDVHGDEGPQKVWRDLQHTPRYELQAMVVALAAMVPDDQPGVGSYLCDVAGRPGMEGGRERGLALLIPRRSQLLQRRRRPGRPALSSEPGGVAVTAQR
jgi:hypothetical protein